jgi:hypothetical protein
MLAGSSVRLAYGIGCLVAPDWMSGRLAPDVRGHADGRMSLRGFGGLYTPNTVFDSFPWPQAPTDAAVAAVCDAVEVLLHYRDERVAEGVTLGRQYASLRDPGRNELRRLHERVDEAVLAVYGFSTEDDMLVQILALNESIAEEEGSGTTQPRRPGNEGLENTRRTQSRLEPSLRLQPTA